MPVTQLHLISTSIIFRRSLYISYAVDATYRIFTLNILRTNGRFRKSREYLEFPGAGRLQRLLKIFRNQAVDRNLRPLHEN